VEFDFSEMDMLSLAYAITIHKSQGSEYPVVVLPIHGQHYVMLRRNLLYTAVTRGKKLVVLVGQAAAMSKAIEAGESSRRWTRLAERIREAFSKSSPNP
jgi:exodeoxyribonuclease V alpha subunit